MRAARIHELNGTPIVEDLPEPEGSPGNLKIKVALAGLQPTDVMRARGLYKAQTMPYIIGGEGVGEVGGRTVYFGHALPSSGGVAEWAVVPEDEVWDLPPGIDPYQVIALAIAGTGALIPLEEARIREGEHVLVLGATGPLGQIAVQAARLLGAGRVTAAARGLPALERLQARGHADAVVRLGSGDDEAALKATAEGGYDVVLDCVYGLPAEAAMRATTVGGRMMSIGVGAGMTMTLSLRDLVGRSHHGVGTGQRPVAERKAAFDRLLRWHQDAGLAVDIVPFDLERVAQAWTAQLGSPGGKIVMRVAE